MPRTNKNGVPVVGLVVAFVLGLIVFLPFPSWQQLVGFITSATVLSFAAGRWSLAALRRTDPSMERPFRVPGGDVIPLLAFMSSNLIVVWAGWTVNWKLFVTVLLGLALLAVQETIRKRNPPLELRSGMWMVAWLAGLTVLSFFAGDLDDDARMGFWTGAALTAIFSVAIYYFAIGSRLPEDTMHEHMEEIRKEAAMEEDAVGSID